MSWSTPSAGGKLSSSLKERLKRCGRYHASPSTKQHPQTNDAKQLAPTQDIAPECLSPGVITLTDRKCFESLLESPLLENGPCLNLIAKNDKSAPRTRFTPVAKQQLLKSNEITSNIKYDSEQENTSMCSISLESDVDDEGQLLKSRQVKTPLTSRSRSLTCTNQIRASKLKFGENECDYRRPHKINLAIEVDNINNSSDNVTVKNDRLTQKCLPVLSRESHDLSQKQELEMTTALIKELKEKEENLRKLKMVKMYRSKNDLTELQLLIDKWRDVSQNALQDLVESMTEPKPTLTQLVDHLGIDHGLVMFNSEDETFT